MICQWLASITASSALFIQPCHSVSAGVQRAGLPAAYTMRQGTRTLSPGVCSVSKRSRCAMLSSHVSAACSVRFCDTIPAVLARLIKSASWLSGVCWSKCSGSARGVCPSINRRSRAARFSQQKSCRHTGSINTIRTCSPLAYRRCAAPAARNAPYDQPAST